MSAAPYLTVSQAAARLGIASPSWVRALCAAGRIAGALRIGRAWLIPIDSFERFADIPRPVGNPTFGRKPAESP